MMGWARRADNWSSAWLLAATGLVIGVGTAAVDPTVATIMALGALGLAAAALFGHDTAALRWVTRRSVTTVLTTGIAFEILVVLAAPPLGHWALLVALVVVGMVGIASGYTERLGTAAVLGAVMVHAACLAYLVMTLVPVGMDVWLFQQEGSAALVSGHNPYALRFPNIYGPGTPFYAPEVMEDGFLTFGFPYPPVSLALALPGYVIGGDYRFAAVAAVSFTAVLVAFALPGPTGRLAATLLLLSPLTFRVLLNGWTEPFAGLLVALVVCAAIRRPSLVPILLGLLIAVKQYLVPILILALVLLHSKPPISWRRAGLIAVGVAALTVLPFILWDPDSFVYSVGIVQVLQPFRADSVSVPGLLARAGGPELPALTAFVIFGIALGLVARRAPRTPAGFLGASVVALLTLFLFSKQAFMNYYFFALVLVTLAVAVTNGSGSPRAVGTPKPVPTAAQ